MDTYNDPGHDATPGYCALCETSFLVDESPVETTWGPMHQECADSHDELEAEAYTAQQSEAE